MLGNIGLENLRNILGTHWQFACGIMIISWEHNENFIGTHWE
jgi:hypothetical protein